MGSPDLSELAETRSCEQCGCDLAERPPMSYAAMEGFLEVQSDEPTDADAWLEEQRIRIVERWVGTVFLGLLAAILMIGLLY